MISRQETSSMNVLLFPIIFCLFSLLLHHSMSVQFVTNLKGDNLLPHTQHEKWCYITILDIYDKTGYKTGALVIVANMDTNMINS